MNEKILILGGTEFVGRQLVEILSNDPTKEIYLFNRGKTNPELFPKVKRIIGDRETNDVEKLKMHQWDYVIDFSSYYPLSLQNTLAQINKTVKKYIYISTISVYDFKGYDSSFSIEEDYKMLTCSPEEAVDQTMKTYGRKKVACEEVLNKTDWLNSIILRPSIIYGNYDPTDRFYYWLRKIKTNKEIILPDQGVDNLSLTYANDLVAIILKGINEDLPNGIYNCNTQETGTLKSMLETMKDLLGSDCQFYGMDGKALNEEKIRFPLFFIGNLLFSNAKVKEASGLTFASFRDTIKSQIAYYETEGWRACKAGMTNEKERAIIEQHKQ